MATQIEYWKNEQANVLQHASSEFRQIANRLESCLGALSGLNQTVFSAQVSGPPAEVLEQRWSDWHSQAQPLAQRLHNLSSHMSHVATDWHNSYQQECRQVQSEAEAAAKQTENNKA